jgi:hypothetical protein
MEATVALPYKDVERPAKDAWRPLPAKFADAVAAVQSCAKKKADDLALVCVHVTPDFVEASDTFQIARYALKTGFKDQFLVRRDSLKHIVELGMTHVAETPNWVHFRSPAKVWLSVRRETEDYPPLDEYLSTDGGRLVVLPKGLKAAAENAGVFSSENADDDCVLLRLAKDRIWVKGVGASGWYEEPKAMAYSGPKMAFRIFTAVLIDFLDKYNEAHVTPEKLVVVAGPLTWLTSLDASEEKKEDGGAE